MRFFEGLALGKASGAVRWSPPHSVRGENHDEDECCCIRCCGRHTTPLMHTSCARRTPSRRPHRCCALHACHGTFEYRRNCRGSPPGEIAASAATASALAGSRNFGPPTRSGSGADRPDSRSAEKTTSGASHLRCPLSKGLKDLGTSSNLSALLSSDHRRHGSQVERKWGRARRMSLPSVQR